MTLGHKSPKNSEIWPQTAKKFGVWRNFWSKNMPTLIKNPDSGNDPKCEKVTMYSENWFNTIDIDFGCGMTQGGTGGGEGEEVPLQLYDGTG